MIMLDSIMIIFLLFLKHSSLISIRMMKIDSNPQSNFHRWTCRKVNLMNIYLLSLKVHKCHISTHNKFIINHLKMSYIVNLNSTDNPFINLLLFLLIILSILFKDHIFMVEDNLSSLEIMSVKIHIFHHNIQFIILFLLKEDHLFLLLMCKKVNHHLHQM